VAEQQTPPSLSLFIGDRALTESNKRYPLFRQTGKHNQKQKQIKTKNKPNKLRQIEEKKYISTRSFFFNYNC
jgi:hypothetical protein